MSARSALDTLSPDEVRERLAGPPAERARFLAAAARAGHAEAQAVLAQMLLDGTDVARDQAAGFAWFNRAAAQGHLMALNMVGRCYDLGWGVAIDKRRAAECYRVAAQRGLDWAMYNLATLLTLGEGVEADRAAALAWFERASALGNAKATNFCGSFAEDGWACPRDKDRAAALYERAARGGDFRGCFNHARMLIERGDEAAGARWIAASLRLGNDRFRRQVRDWLARHAPSLAIDGAASC
jgi:uncharacterized protein